MYAQVQEAADTFWGIAAVGFIAAIWWATRRYVTRHPKEEPMNVTDPVCGMSIKVDQAASKVEREGKTFYFCSEACRKQFDADPAKYAGRTQPGPGAHH